MNVSRKLRFDTDAIALANPIEAVVSNYVPLKRKGREWRAACPFHSEQTPSFDVIPAEADKSGKGFFHCKGCGATGDQFKFLMMLLGVAFPEACEILGGIREAPAATIAPRALELARDPYSDLAAVPPPDDGQVRPGVLLECWNAKRAEDTPPKPICRLRPSMTFEYRDPLGFLLGYVLRCELPNGKKWTPQLRWARCPDGRERWAIWHFDTPRPLYGLDRLTHYHVGPVWLVEGEKSADAASKMLGELAMTWPGGTNGAAHADWSPLKGREVILWGDADQPGWDVMTGFPERNGSEARPGVISLATAAGARVRSVIRWDQEKLTGWDAGDAINEMNADELRAWLRRQSIDGGSVLEFAPIAGAHGGI